MFVRSKLYSAVVFGVVMASTLAHAEDESVAQKVHDAGMTVSNAVEKGASTANEAVTKGFDKANEKVFKPADHWIQSKVNPKGAASAPKPQGPAANSP